MLNMKNISAVFIIFLASLNCNSNAEKTSHDKPLETHPTGGSEYTKHTGRVDSASINYESQVNWLTGQLTSDFIVKGHLNVFTTITLKQGRVRQQRYSSSRMMILTATGRRSFMMMMTFHVTATISPPIEQCL
jgi:hypothetical protein